MQINTIHILLWTHTEILTSKLNGKTQYSNYWLAENGQIGNDYKHNLIALGLLVDHKNEI